MTEITFASSPPTSLSASPELVLIVGLAGAGYSTALNILEDVGFSAVDNLPFALISQIISLEVETNAKKLAVSVDSRTSGFDANGLIALMADLRHRLGDRVRLVFLTASEVELARRFNATRRHHPLDDNDEGLTGAIRRDWQQLEKINAIADIAIDTSGTSPTHFRTALLAQLGVLPKGKLPVLVSSFSYRRGIPSDTDMVLDMRFLDNPHWQPDLAPLTGLDEAVANFIKAHERFDATMASLKAMLNEMLPRFAAEGRPQFSIGFGCTGGRHRSVFTAEFVAEMISAMGHEVRVKHREL